MRLLPTTQCPIHPDCYTFVRDDGTKTCEAWEEMSTEERKQDDEGMALIERILSSASTFAGRRPPRNRS